MCGIIGVISQTNVVDKLSAGLKRLEYRGYDSAGIAVVDQAGNICVRKCIGKIKDLQSLIKNDPLSGVIGIAHTRWATHGAPSSINAHPHVSNEQLAIVHNGIIENHAILRELLIKQGYEFCSETDTEVIAHLAHLNLTEKNDPVLAISDTVNVLEGAYAIGVIFKEYPDQIFAARHGSPLIIGIGDAEYFIASDIFALLPYTRKYIVLEDGDIAQINLGSGVTITDAANHKIERPVQMTDVYHDEADKTGFNHYMQKEIFQQPTAIKNTLAGNISDGDFNILDMDKRNIFSRMRAVHIVACGTSYHAGMVARYWFEKLAGIPCAVDIASEYRNFDFYVEPETLFVVISQSGETADTLSALQKAKTENYLSTLSICNAPDSSITRETELQMMTMAGVEIGVASTKAFTTQLLNLLTLCLAIAKVKRADLADIAQWMKQVHDIPAHMEVILGLNDHVRVMAERFATKDHALYLGRGIMLPIAMEGALKLKEISYIHAEAYPAGELKHGPLALVDANMPVIAVAPNNELLSKLISNLQEVHARGGELYVFSDSRIDLGGFDNAHKLHLDVENNLLAPIYYALPMQLLAYHVAVLKGADVDQPRNLAKSVTVE